MIAAAVREEMAVVGARALPPGAEEDVVVLDGFFGEAFVPLEEDVSLPWPLEGGGFNDAGQGEDADLIENLADSLFGAEEALVVQVLNSARTGGAEAKLAPATPHKKRRLFAPSIPDLCDERPPAQMVAPSLGDERPRVVEEVVLPPGGVGALLNSFKLDLAEASRRRGGLSASEYRRTKAIPRYKNKRGTRNWAKARAPMYKSRTTAASSRRREGGKFTSGPSGWRSAAEIFGGDS